MRKLFEEKQAVLKGFVGQVPVLQILSRSKFEEGRDSILLNVMGSMAVQPETWDELCQTNIGIVASVGLPLPASILLIWARTKSAPSQQANSSVF